MEELCYYIKENSLCGLGQTAPNPVLSTLQYFRDEYEAHVVEQALPRRSLQGPAPTTPLIPTSARAAPCAPGTALRAPFPAPSRSLTVIDTTKCIKCGVCMEKCKFGAVVRK